MAANGTIDFWFSIGSAYTYLSVMRLDDIERYRGIGAGFRMDWNPPVNQIFPTACAGLARIPCG